MRNAVVQVLIMHHYQGGMYKDRTRYWTLLRRSPSRESNTGVRLCVE